MKKRLLTMLALLANVVLAAVAQDTPAITFEGSAGVERTITVGVAAAGTIKVDWGDGTLVSKEATTAYDLKWDENGVEFTGTPTGTVKIYADGIVAFDGAGKFNEDKTDIPNALTAIDVTGAPDLVNLYLNANKISSIDLSKNTQLVKLNIANNNIAAIELSAQVALTTFTANDNQLSALDLSKNVALTTVTLSNNKLTTLDFTNNPLIKTFTVLNNELTAVTFGANTTKNHTIQFGGNKLTGIDLTGFTTYSGTYLRLRDNNISNAADIILPGTINQLWADGNALSLSELYALKSKAKTLTYATLFESEQAQQPYAIAESIEVNGTVDLSSQAKLGETATNFVWKNAEGTALVEGTDYTVADGVFTFLTTQEAIHCEMTNAEFPLFTAEKPYMTTVMKVEGGGTGIRTIAADKAQGVWYNLKGQRVDSAKKGLYIVNGVKVVIK